MKKNTKTSKVLYWVTVSALILIIVVCAGLIGTKLITDAVDKEEWSEIQDLRPEVTRPPLVLDVEKETEPTEKEPVQEPTIAPNIDDTVLLEYQLLYELNKDMVGWIQIEGTEIDYPVVQTPNEPNYYLRRSFDKSVATCGSIYVREACDVNLPSDNITIYGHNMKNGTMFAALHKYKSKSFWEDHRYVHFDTLNEYHTYEIFAVFNTTADLTKGFTYHIYDTFPTEIEFNQFVSTCKNIDMYETGVIPVFGDKLITLSTCDRGYDPEGRLVVVARRIQ